MIQSMTGYGRTELNLKNANFTIEIRSLNSKQIDANIKMPSIYRDKEIKLRKLLSEKLQRGKIELSIWSEVSASSPKYTLNTELIKDYFYQIQQVNQSLGINNSDVMPSLLKMPEILLKGEERVDNNEWEEILLDILNRLQIYNQFLINRFNITT